MDSIDDDFGDLYADVEVQVKSTFNNTPEFTTLYTEPEPEDDNNNYNKKSNLKSNTTPEENFVSESTQKAPIIEGDDGSDSEDELKIVLNDEDCERFPVNGGGGGDDENEVGFHQIGSDKSELNANSNGHGYNFQYKYNRSHVATLPSNLRADGSAIGAKGDWEDNGFNQHKGSNSGQVANIRAGCRANSVVPQCAYGFSLPWYRTILDVNIDAFQEKPWSHRGANATDFFNFGFNEDSWKRFCNLLDQYQDRTYLQARYPAYGPSKPNQAHGVGSKREKVDKVARSENLICVGSSSKSFDKGERPLELPKGRAIEVEGSTVERQPSVDVRRPCFRDSDVVIQINVQDSAEDFSGSSQEEVGHIDSNSSDHETSKNGNLDLDHKRDVHHCRTASDDELSADSVGRYVRNFCMASTSRRCSEPLGSGGHANGKILDGDKYHHGKVNVFTSEGTPEPAESLNKAEELVGGRYTCKSDSYLIETELSLDELYHFSTSPSCSGSDSEPSKDSVHNDPVKICTHLRRSSPNLGSEFKDSVTSDHKNSISNDFKTIQSNRRSYLRHRSSSREDRKHHRGRHHGVTERKSYPESDDDASPMSNRKGGGKYYLRHVPVKEKWKNCHGVICSASEQKIHPDNGGNTSKMSDAEGLYDRDYGSFDCSRKNERLFYFDYHHTEDLSYYKETGLSSGYGKERFGDNHVWTVHKKHPRGRHHPTFRDQMDQYVRKKRDEKEYDCGSERSFRVDNEDDMDRDWYHYKRGISTEEMIPLAYGESRRLASKCSSTYKERDTKWKSKNDKLRFGNKIDYDGGFPDYNQDDEFVLEKYGRSVSFTDRERDSFDGKYERDFPLIGMEVEMPVKRGRSATSSQLHFNRSWPMEVESVCWRRKNHQSSVSQLYRKCYKANRGRLHDTMSSIDYVYDSKLTERYGRHRRLVSDEEYRDNDCFGIYNDIDRTKDSIMDDNDPIQSGRRHSWQSKELLRMEDELITRGQENDFFAEKASFSYEEVSLHEKVHAKYESDRDAILIDDVQLEHHRYRLITGVNSDKCVNRNYDMYNRGENEHTILRRRDSFDFIIGEGKSSGGRFNGRSLMCNDRSETMEMKLANEKTTWMDFHESDTGKIVKTNIWKIEINKNTDKWLDKYQATEHSEDLDVEEGQIIMWEPDMENPKEKGDVSESIVPTCNVKRRISCSGNASGENNDVRNYDKQHILETLAKMEKRRERFKNPITLKKEPDKNPDPRADLMVDTTETKQRPARKRRWGGS